MKGLTLITFLALSLNSFATVSIFENFEGRYKVVNEEASYVACSLALGSIIELKITNDRTQMDILSKGKKIYLDRRAFDSTYDKVTKKLGGGMKSISLASEDGLIVTQITKKKFKTAALQKQVLSLSADLSTIYYSFEEREALKELCYLTRLD